MGTEVAPSLEKTSNFQSTKEPHWVTLVICVHCRSIFFATINGDLCLHLGFQELDGLSYLSMTAQAFHKHICSSRRWMWLKK